MGTQSKAAIELRSLAWEWARESEAITAAAQTLHPMVRRLGVEPFARVIGITLGGWSARAWPHYSQDILAAGLLLRACPRIDHRDLAGWVEQGRSNALAPHHTNP